MPDMTSTYLGTDAAAQTAFVDSISSVASDPAVYHLGGGELVLAPFAADARTPAWWSSVVQALSAKGIQTALWPVFVSPWSAATATFEAAQVKLHGTSSWGPATVPGATGYAANAMKAHGMGLAWMSPVRPQDSRPKDLVYSEPSNSQTMRLLWDAAIQGDAEWVEIVTWNDYSEATEISPSTGTQWANFDLTAYYAAWYKTGKQPAIVRDALYWSHRLQSTSALPDLSKQKAAYKVVNGAPPVDEIELLAFLTAPATLEIEIAGAVKSSTVAAGVQSFRIPLVEGTPTFRILRGGKTVASVDSAFAISNTITYQDLLYRGGGSLACDRSALMQ